MRKLILKMSVSFDGFVCGKNGEIDWIFRSMCEDGAAWTVDKLWQAGAHLIGRKSFQDMAAYWPSSLEPFAKPMNEIPKIVFSKTGLDFSSSSESTQGLQDAIRHRSNANYESRDDIERNLKSWREAEIVSGDLKTEILRLKTQDGKNLLAHGGASFAQSLVQFGLVDEYNLLIHPIAIGQGLGLFSHLPKPLDLKVVSATPFTSGAVGYVLRPI